MKSLVLCVLLAMVACRDSILLEKPDPKAFDEVFGKLAANQKPGDFGYELLSQLKEKVVNGGKIVDVRDHIMVLKGHLTDDQIDDDNFVSEEKARIEGELQFLQHQNDILEQEEKFLEEKLNVINSQAQVVDALFTQDSVAYAARVGTLHSMIDTLDELVEKIKTNIQHAEIMLQKTDLFETLKRIGKGKHVDVLAELTAHLDHDLVERILVLFAELRQSILETLGDDEVQEAKNVALHNQLRAEISEIIEATNARLQEIQDDESEREAEIKTQEEREAQLLKDYEDRTNGRQQALDTTQEAHDLLNDNLEKLSHWEGLAE